VKTASVAWFPANNFPTRDAGAPRSTAGGMRLAADGAEGEPMSGGSGDYSSQVSVELNSGRRKCEPKPFRLEPKKNFMRSRRTLVVTLETILVSEFLQRESAWMRVEI
jgi:hypothetical protein